MALVIATEEAAQLYWDASQTLHHGTHDPDMLESAIVHLLDLTGPGAVSPRVAALALEALGRMGLAEFATTA